MKRYNPHIEGEQHPHVWMKEEPDGKWVLYEDVVMERADIEETLLVWIAASHRPEYEPEPQEPEPIQSRPIHP